MARPKTATAVLTLPEQPRKDRTVRPSAMITFPEPTSQPQSKLALPTVLPMTVPSPTPLLPVAPATSMPATSVPPTSVPPTSLPPTPIPTERPLAILNFTATAVELEEGKRITFAWDSTGGQEAFIYNWAQGSMRFPTGWEVPVSGSITVDVSGTEQADPSFQLFVYDSARNSVDASVIVPWICEHEEIFSTTPGSCTGKSATVSLAAEQIFENGRMLWLHTNELPLSMIYVLYDTPFAEGGVTRQWQRFPDTWTEADLDSDPNLIPPDGLYQPARGFGKVWRETPGMRDRLGWATTPETGFDTVWRLSISESLVSYRSIRLANGQGVMLTGEPKSEHGWLWEVFTP